MSNLKQYTPSIDGMRSVAVLSVILNHFNEKILPSGFLGVDVFFVISGFVITASLVGRKEKKGIDFFWGFYKRRIKRLLPALLFYFFISGLLICMINPNPQSHLLTGLYSLIGFANVELYFNAVNYWGEDAKLNPFTHTWSLGVEEQFYLVFPLMLWLLTKGRYTRNSLNKVKWLLIVAIIFSLTLFLIFSTDYPSATYFLIPFRFWEIGIGCTLFLFIHQSHHKIFKRIQHVPLLPMLLTLVCIFFIPKEHLIISVTLTGIITSLIILKLKCIEYYSQPYEGILSWKITQYIGKISYSLYLWHWIAIVLAKWTVGISIITTPILIAFIVLFSTFSYHMIEKPMRHLQWNKSVNIRLFIVTCVSFITFSIGLQISYKNNTNPLYIGSNNPTNTKSYQLNVNSLPCVNHSKPYKNIRTVGNSHANHILPMLKIVASKCGLNVLHEQHPNYIVIPSGNHIHHSKIEQVVSELDEGDILVLSSRNHFLYVNPYLKSTGDIWFDRSEIKSKKGFGLKMWLEELDLILKLTKLKNINVVLFLPSIEFDQPVANYRKMCQNTWLQTEPAGCRPKVSKSYLNDRFPEEFYTEIKKRAGLNPLFHLFDPEPVLCHRSQSHCSRVINGVVAFVDTNHLSSDGAKLLTEPFTSLLVQKGILDSKN